MAQEICDDGIKLLRQATGVVRFAAQTAAPDSAAAEREVQPRVLELWQDRFFDLVERDGTSGYAMFCPLERARDLTNAFRRIRFAGAVDRIVIDHRLQHDREIGRAHV